jgi:hypothetical protein
MGGHVAETFSLFMPTIAIDAARRRYGPIIFLLGTPYVTFFPFAISALGFEIAVWQGMIRDIFEYDAMYLLND